MGLGIGKQMDGDSPEECGQMSAGGGGMTRFAFLVGFLFLLLDFFELVVGVPGPNRLKTTDYDYVLAVAPSKAMSAIGSFVVAHFAIKWLYQVLEQEWRPGVLYLLALPQALMIRLLFSS